MNQAQTIALYQPMLIRIAHQMVGSLQDAEDIVQDTFLKWLSVDHEKINNTKAYLIKSVTNNCINHLNAFNEKKKEYIETYKAFEFVEKDDFEDFDFSNELSEALKHLHRKLEPVEKAMYLMREVFNYEYEELQHIFEKKKDNCRQLVSRAKEKLTVDKIKFTIDLPTHKSFFDSFRKACKLDDPEELIAKLNREIQDRKKL